VGGGGGGRHNVEAVLWFCSLRSGCLFLDIPCYLPCYLSGHVAHLDSGV